MHGQHKRWWQPGRSSGQVVGKVGCFFVIFVPGLCVRPSLMQHHWFGTGQKMVLLALVVCLTACGSDPKSTGSPAADTAGVVFEGKGGMRVKQYRDAELFVVTEEENTRYHRTRIQYGGQDTEVIVRERQTAVFSTRQEWPRRWTELAIFRVYAQQAIVQIADSVDEVLLYPVFYEKIKKACCGQERQGIIQGYEQSRPLLRFTDQHARVEIPATGVWLLAGFDNVRRQPGEVPKDLRLGMLRMAGPGGVYDSLELFAKTAECYARLNYRTPNLRWVVTSPEDKLTSEGRHAEIWSQNTEDPAAVSVVIEMTFVLQEGLKPYKTVRVAFGQGQWAKDRIWIE